MSIPKKPSQCRICKQSFQPVKPLQSVCSFECEVQRGIILAEKSKLKREQAERVADLASRKILRERLKTARDYIKEAQIAFNAYIRERDKDQLCICCNQPLQSGTVGGNYDCGHYRSVGSAPHLRFDPRNAHAQRKQCNRWGAGRAVDYRLGLIARIGIEAVESLESDQGQAKYSIEELKEIKATYKAKLKALKRGEG
jgi:hypothetical protein